MRCALRLLLAWQLRQVFKIAASKRLQNDPFEAVVAVLGFVEPNNGPARSSCTSFLEIVRLYGQQFDLVLGRPVPNSKRYTAHPLDQPKVSLLVNEVEQVGAVRQRPRHCSKKFIDAPFILEQLDTLGTEQIALDDRAHRLPTVLLDQLPSTPQVVIGRRLHRQ